LAGLAGTGGEAPSPVGFEEEEEAEADDDDEGRGCCSRALLVSPFLINPLGGSVRARAAPAAPIPTMDLDRLCTSPFVGGEVRLEGNEALSKGSG
jgi:hypothetical protein